MSKIVPYSIAYKLKRLGYHNPCNQWWYASKSTPNEAKLEGGYNHNREQWIYGDMNLNCSAMTFEEAFEWFEENFNLECVIQHNNDFVGYNWNIYIIDKQEYRKTRLDCSNYIIITKNEAKINALEYLTPEELPIKTK